MPEPLILFEPPEDVDAARILDASANRCREALRVLEDHCRFVLNDALLSGQLKQLRHDLAGLMKAFPQRLLLEARDTLDDVGTTLSTAQERERSSIAEVVQANAKRLQEALRTLEEFSKIFSPELGSAFEKIRYQSYTIERALLLGGHARERLANAHLVCAGHRGDCAGSRCYGTVAEAMAGGAQIIQLREKKRPDGELLKMAKEIRRMTRQAGVLFIVNDRPDIARLAEADGVHLGQDDMPLREARRIVGGDALIGVSTHNLEQVRRAVLEGANYLGVGPTFPSRTKDFAEFPGLEFVAQALAETSLPAFALGGVNLDTLPALTAIGCRRIAVSHAVWRRRGSCAGSRPSCAVCSSNGLHMLLPIIIMRDVVDLLDKPTRMNHVFPANLFGRTAGLVFLGAASLACDFCQSERGPTIAADYFAADVVLLVRVEQGPVFDDVRKTYCTDVTIDRVIKEHGFIKGKKTIRLKREIPKIKSQILLFCEVWKDSEGKEQIDAHRGVEVPVNSEWSSTLKNRLS